MPWELYLIESKPIAVCVQVVLEFVIFLIATILWLTWCSKHIKTRNDSEAKSLAFALPGYLLGWTCLMMTRLFGSRLKEKFCFSFYLASGVRFMCSAAILFPEFSREWYSVAYGVISLLCFVNTIFHIVTHPNPERRPVRRLIGPDGTLSEDPPMELMTVKQLENYIEIVRNFEYMEKLKEAPQVTAVRSAEAMTVSLHDSPDVTIRSDSVFTGGTSRSATSRSASPKTYPGDNPRITVAEVDVARLQLASSNQDLRTLQRKTSSGLGVIPGTTRRYSDIRISQITIQSKQPSEGGEHSVNVDDHGAATSPRLSPNRSTSQSTAKSPSPDLTVHGSLRDGTSPEPAEHKPMVKFRSFVLTKSTTYPSLTAQELSSARAIPVEPNQIQKCRRGSMDRNDPYAILTSDRTVEGFERGVSRFSEERIFDMVGPEARSPLQQAAEHRPGRLARKPLFEQHLTRGSQQGPKVLQYQRGLTCRSKACTSVESPPPRAVESLTRDTSRWSEHQIFDTIIPATRPHVCHNHRANCTVPRIHRVLCPLHQQQTLRTRQENGT